MAKKKTGNSSSNKGKSDSGDSSSLKAATAVKCRHILVEKQSLAEKAIERLRAGESFDSVAREMSTDKARHGGSLGWMTRATAIGPFMDAALKLPASESSKPIFTDPPVKSKFGFHIIMVEERK